MTSATTPTAGSERLRSGRITPTEMEEFKSRDNWTNWRYLALNWFVIIATLFLAIWGEDQLRSWGYGWEAIGPLALVAIIVMGASQHQLGGAIHEGTHYQLFADRTLNEVAADWLAGFPIYTSTHHYRLHHMAHHQFVNDPERDPIFGQADESGHWLDFPLTHFELVKGLLRLLWIPNLVRYTVARARYSALGLGRNPYVDPRRPGHPAAQIVGILFAGIVPAVLIGMMLAGFGPTAVMGTFFVLWAAAVLFYATIPDDWFASGRVEPVISHRAGSIARISFMAIVYGSLTAIDLGGYEKAWMYYGLYWIVPLFTMFPVFMIFREWIQHGNADRGRYTNSRVILTGPLFRYAVLPWGMDYHLPHHLMATVPHYKLKKFHERLQQDSEYAGRAQIVQGLYGPAHAPTGRPTAFGVLLNEHAPKKREVVHVDETVLERAHLNDRAALEREVEESLKAERRGMP